MALVKDLCFNLSLLILLMFIFNLWAERYNKEPVPRVLSMIGLLLALLVCLSFSTPRYGVMIDLRLIPIIIGGLYFGFGLLLTFASILIRVLLYGTDNSFWTVLSIYVSLGIFLKYAHPWFLRQSSKKRLSISLIIAAFTGFIIFTGLLFTGHSISELKVVLVTLSIQCIGICMISFLLEEMKQNVFFREQMVQAQKIELASHMSAAISHEVRNPLTAVQGFLQLAAEDPNLQKTTKGYIDIALTELNEAEHVIKNYLTFAQPSMSTVETFNAGTELQSIIKTLQPLANMNSVEVVTVNHDACFLLGDKIRFRQCFLNILKNCIEAMPNGGILTLYTEVKNKEVHISVTDTGIGMSADQVKRLGEPYYSTKGKKGTGLGLMVSFSIIRELKGTVKITSEIGKGAEFLVTFPAYLQGHNTNDPNQSLPV
ncbi:sensor histidine kinase [Peribacillus deserti]|uniref:histidine kinase n=1 Tax=Peribacillus deserti TaxID=673318 RepID=A0A2N5M0S5_9BACI|nr:HAMP domain-containing sensor histidine kinase [Peribacillus deserti]PLT27883.1 histidine kinase [Peribacillus deserti]